MMGIIEFVQSVTSRILMEDWFIEIVTDRKIIEGLENVPMWALIEFLGKLPFNTIDAMVSTECFRRVIMSEKVIRKLQQAAPQEIATFLNNLPCEILEMMLENEEFKRAITTRFEKASSIDAFYFVKTLSSHTYKRIIKTEWLMAILRDKLKGTEFESIFKTLEDLRSINF